MTDARRGWLKEELEEVPGGPMNEVRRYAPYVPCPTCTANRPRLCDLHYRQGAEAFLQAVKHAIADPRTPDGVKAAYEELLAQNRALAARVQAMERERGELKEKAYRYAHWTPEHTIEEWLADRQRIVEAKQVEADAALRQQLTAMTAERDEAIKAKLMAYKEVENLMLKLAEAQATVARQQDRIDLQCDEFQRIAAIAGNDEIKGLCARAVKDIRQHVPVIQQRDTAEQQVARLREALTAISLCSVNNASSKAECGDLARQALRETGA